MIPYKRAFLVSMISNAAVVLPIGLLNGLPLLDALGIAAMVGFVGTAPAIRACSVSDATLSEKRRLATKFALFMPIFVLLIQAIVWSSFRFAERGTLLPGTVLHWTNWIVAIAAFVSWIAFYYDPKGSSDDGPQKEGQKRVSLNNCS